MANLNHIGRLANNKRKVVVAYRVLPGDPDNCLVVQSDNLAAEEHDTLMKLVESPTGQQAYELAEAMARTSMPDGRNLLAAFHKFGRLLKLPTSSVEMTPNTRSSINLAELNKILAEQKGVDVADLAIKPKSTTEKVNETQQTETEEITQESVDVAQIAEQPQVLTDEDIARQYRAQADAMYKEAKRLRDEAEKLSPTKRKTKKTESVE